MTQQEKITKLITTLANTPNSDESISFVLDLATQSVKAETLEKLVETGALAPIQSKGGENNPQMKNLHTIKFTEKEVCKMDKTFKKYFILNGYIAHVTKRKSGKNGCVYQLRFRRCGYDVEASSADLQKAKRKFLEKTLPENIGRYLDKKQKSGFNLLEEVFAEWHQCKQGTVGEKEHKRFEANFLSLPETIRQKPIRTIRTVDIDSIMKEVKPRKYEELRTLFNGIFKYAVASGIIQHNPVALIKFKRAERQSRDALPRCEIIGFLERIRTPKYTPIRQAMYLLYFFGLRPCEVDEETRREGNFLIVRNRKRKNGKIEYKKIPIPLASRE